MSSSSNANRSRPPEGAWDRLQSTLQVRGLWPLPKQGYQSVEERFVHAMPVVQATPQFRQALGSNLALLAQHKGSGIVIQADPPYRTGLIIGATMGALATIALIVTAIVLLTRGDARRSGVA